MKKLAVSCIVLHTLAVLLLGACARPKDFPTNYQPPQYTHYQIKAAHDKNCNVALGAFGLGSLGSALGIIGYVAQWWSGGGFFLVPFGVGVGGMLYSAAEGCE